MSNLQTHYHFKLDFQKVDQHTGGKCHTKRHKDNQLQSLVGNGEHDTKESEGNMFNPIFKENVQGRKHRRSCAFVEPELLSYRRPKGGVHNGKNGYKNLNDSHNYHDGNHDEIELYQGNSKYST